MLDEKKIKNESAWEKLKRGKFHQIGKNYINILVIRLIFKRIRIRLRKPWIRIKSSGKKQIRPCEKKERLQITNYI